jgi:hypothetical protein
MEMKMKSLVLVLSTILLASNAFAHTLKTVGSLTNRSANQALSVAEDINKKNEKTTAVNSYKVTGLEIKEGEDKDDAYIRVLKSALHRDYPITGDDGGYDISALGARATSKEIAAALGDSPFSESAELVTAIHGALASGLLVVAGTGSGNNTMATIVGIIDEKKGELLYLIDSNFGSDD